MCPNKASLSLFTPSLCSFSTASIFHNFSINLVLLLLHLICLQTACWFLKHSLYIKISLAHSRSVLFSKKNCEGNSLLRIPDLAMESFADFVPFQKYIYLEVQSCSVAAMTAVWTVIFLAIATPGAGGQSLHFIPSKHEVGEQSLWKYALHTSSPNSSSWLSSVFNLATSLSALKPSSPVLQMYRL